MNSSDLISATKAFQLIQNEMTLSQIEELPLELTLGCFLREEIKAERDAPPFHRAMMDGIALNASDLIRGQKIFPITGIARAGHPSLTLAPQKAVEVCTGAIVPQGADKIIPYENLHIKNDQAHVIDFDTETFIHRHGSDFKKNDILLHEGQKLNAPLIGLCAGQGRAKLKVSKLPTIAIISTGDELVDLTSPLEIHQIRRSNPYALAGELHSWGFKKTKTFHLPDDKEAVEAQVKKLLHEYQFLIFSGAVSAGAFDFLPLAFEQNNISKIFHKVAQKPGKPLFFGKGPQDQIIFALPGNPISALINLRRYVIPALLKHMGCTQRDHLFVSSETPLKIKKGICSFIPARILEIKGRLLATALPSNNSGDYHSLTPSHGFLLVDESTNQENIPFYPWGQWNFYGPEL